MVSEYVKADQRRKQSKEEIAFQELLSRNNEAIVRESKGSDEFARSACFCTSLD
jgi:hypothetical protein